MLPLTPPLRVPDPGYPARSRLLASPGLRRQALAVLAGVALAGCTSSAPAQQQPIGSTAPPARPAARVAAPLRAEDLDIEVGGTVTMGISPMVRPAEPAEPATLIGEMEAPSPPLPLQLLGEISAPIPPISLDLPAAPKADV